MTMDGYIGGSRRNCQGGAKGGQEILVPNSVCSTNNGGSRMGHLGQMPHPSRNLQDRDTLIEQSITLIKQSQCS